LNLIFKHTRQVRKQAIYEMFRKVFAAAEMTCIVENLFEDGELAFLMRRNPLELSLQIHSKFGASSYNIIVRIKAVFCAILGYYSAHMRL
jgi:hypothetical protein